MADAEIVVLAVPSQQLRDNLESWSEHVPADAVHGEPHEGRRARHAQAHERGHRRDHRRRSRAHRGRLRPQPGPRDRQPRARRQRRGVRGPGRRRTPAEAVPLGVVPPLLDDRCHRLRARRHRQEHHRPRGRSVRRPRLRRQHQGLGHHPRARRDGAARCRDRRRPRHLHGTRRHGRPRRHVLVAAVTQPYVRREARPGHECRRGHGADQPGRRGREVVRVGQRARQDP